MESVKGQINISSFSLSKSRFSRKINVGERKTNKTRPNTKCTKLKALNISELLPVEFGANLPPRRLFYNGAVWLVDADQKSSHGPSHVELAMVTLTQQ